jgi:hypothetical protein
MLKILNSFSPDGHIYFRSTFNKTGFRAVCVDENLPQGWMGGRWTVEVPPRSSALNTMDSYFWQVIKDKVYRTKAHNADEVRVHYTEAI